MSDSLLASLYGSTPLVMADASTAAGGGGGRGVDPEEGEEAGGIARLEPAGSRHDEAIEVTELPGRKEIAHIVGLPPPPPRAPPPRKGKRSKTKRRNKTPGESRSIISSTTIASNASSSVANHTERVEDGENSRVSPSSATTATTTTAATKSQPAEYHRQPFSEWEHTQNLANKTPSPPVTASPRNLVEERRLKALATYHSDTLVQGDDFGNIERLLTPSTLHENQSTVSKSTTGTTTTTTANKKTSFASPKSAATKSSDLQDAIEMSLSKARKMESNSEHQLLPNITETSSSGDDSKEKRRRGFSLERRGRKQDKDEKKQPKKRSGGLLKNLFGRGRDPEPAIVMTATESTSVVAKKQQQQVIPPPPPSMAGSLVEKAAKEDMSGERPPLPREVKKVDAIDADILANRSTSPVKTKPSVEEADPVDFDILANRSKSPVPGMDEQTEEDAILASRSLPTSNSDESSGLVYSQSLPSSSNDDATHDASTTTTASQLLFSHDPPDDEHGDPPEKSGRPLVSPTSRKMKASSSETSDGTNDVTKTSTLNTRSRIAEMYETTQQDTEDDDCIADLPGSLSEDRADQAPLFPDHHDEISALTGPTGLFHQDESVSTLENNAGAASEDFNPYATNVLAAATSQPDSKARQLRLDVPPTRRMEPMGESPMFNGPRGRGVPPGAYQDPVGDSPMAWRKNGESAIHDPPEFEDPILSVGYISDNDSATTTKEEKKEEEGDCLPPKPSLDTSLRTTSALKETPRSANLKNATPRSAMKGSTPRMSDTKKLLRVQTKEGEENGFKPNQPEMSDDQNPTVFDAAFTNAKAVAYLHQLHGEPSPRHTWHTAKSKTSEPSPVGTKQERRKRKKKIRKSTPQKPSPSDYGAHNFDETVLREDSVCTKSKPPSPENRLRSKGQSTIDGPQKMFAAYSSKFAGRKPTLKKAPLPEVARGVDGASIVVQVATPRGRSKSGNDVGFKANLPVLKPGKITSLAVARGIKLRKSKRDADVKSGRSSRVILQKKPKTEGVNRFKFYPSKEEDIKDPIQRAGRRLLSKAAIPIQSAVRRYLAKSDAIDRMWALIEIQSCLRRWRAETNLLAQKHSATLMQAHMRGSLARKNVAYMNYSATQIQKVVRSHLVAAEVYDTMFFITRVQAFMKGCYERKMLQKRNEASLSLQRYCRGFQVRRHLLATRNAVPIQAMVRGFSARQNLALALYSTCLIQSIWRSYSAQSSFQYEIVDIIIAQSMARRWAASRHVRRVRRMQHYGPVSTVQARWRGIVARGIFQRYVAARNIQSIWRTSVCLSEYRRQSSARKIQAAYRGYDDYSNYRQFVAARKIQSNWRCHTAETQFIRTISSRKIQAVWRSYVVYSQFLRIISARMIQAAWRGQLVHKDYKQTVSARMIQAAWRGQLVHKAYKQTVSARQIQAAWRGQLVHKDYKRTVSARKIQSVYRRTQARSLFKEHLAARKIQAIWRGFHSYTDYIFALVDVLVMQRTVRKWLAIRRVTAIKEELAALIVQTNWRRHKAQNNLLYSLVHIIVAQSVVRRYLSKVPISRRLDEIAEDEEKEKQRQQSATTIQKSWRGFWNFSQYIIVQYEVTRFQAIIRGMLAREKYSLTLGCTIIIQATGRQFLAKKAVARRVIENAVTESTVLALRERNAAKHIQFWWRIVLDWMKEKKAALTIERFFLNVKEEVDREIRRRERKLSRKKEKRNRKIRRDSEDQILERAWLNTVDENTVATYDSNRRKSAPLPSRSHPLVSPSARSQVGQEVDLNGWPIQIQPVEPSPGRSKLPTHAVTLAPSEDSDVSGITTPSVLYRGGGSFSYGKPQFSVKPANTSRTEEMTFDSRLEHENAGVPMRRSASMGNQWPPMPSKGANTEELSVGDREADARSSRDKRMTTQDYINKYVGLKSAPNRVLENQDHFFAEGKATPRHGATMNGAKRLSNDTPSRSFSQVNTPTSSRSVTKTPRSRAASPHHTPRSRAASPHQTPRSHAASPHQTPRSHAASPHQNMISPRFHLGAGRPGKHLSDPEGQTTRGTVAPSPRQGHLINPQGRNQVMVMKNKSTYSDSRSLQEAQEVMYLGVEYGEV